MRYDKLLKLYYDAIYAEIEELKQPRPSPAVLEVCIIAKRVMWRELHNRKDFIAHREVDL